MLNECSSKDEPDSKGTMDLSDEPSQISNVEDSHSGEKEENKSTLWSRFTSKKDTSASTG